MAFVLPILEYCSPVWGAAAECHLQLLERQVYSEARVCRCVIDVMLLGGVCCTRLNHCLFSLFSELSSASTRVRHTRAAEIEV